MESGPPTPKWVVAVWCGRGGTGAVDGHGNDRLGARHRGAAGRWDDAVGTSAKEGTADRARHHDGLCRAHSALAAAPWSGLAGPTWWQRLDENFELALPRSWSAQPYFTLEAGARTLVCLLWLCWWVCRLPDYDALRPGHSTVVTGIAVLAVAALVSEPWAGASLVESPVF